MIPCIEVHANNSANSFKNDATFSIKKSLEVRVNYSLLHSQDINLFDMLLNIESSLKLEHKFLLLRYFLFTIGV